MAEKRSGANERPAAVLGRHRIFVVLYRLLAYGFIIVMLWLLFRKHFLAGVACLLPIGVFGGLMREHEKRLKGALGDSIICGVVDEMFDHAEYGAFGHIPGDLVRSAGMVFPFAYQSVNGSDHIRAVYRGLDIQFSDIALYNVPAEGGGEKEDEVWQEKVFQGQWLVCDFGRPLSGEVRLSANTKALRRQLGGGVIEMEDPAFNGRFLVTAESAQDAYYLLTPHIMETLLAAAERSGGEVYMAFLRGGELHIAVRSGRDFFELGGSRADTDALRQKFQSELRWFTGIIDALRPEDTLYRRDADA